MSSRNKKESEPGERKSGLYRLLGQAWVYNLSRRVFGSARVRDVLVQDYVGPTEGLQVLDIGCGTAELYQWLPGCEYHGFDPNPSYVTSARNLLDGAGSVWPGSIEEPNLPADKIFDIAIGYGVAHHVPDATAAAFFQLAARHLRPNGRLFTVDPCTYDGQPSLARRVVLRDRGPWVRTPDGYRDLAIPWFEEVECNIRNDLLRIPYTHLMMVSSSPRNA